MKNSEDIERISKHIDACIDFRTKIGNEMIIGWKT